MRLFVALYPPEDVREHLRQWLTAEAGSPLGPVDRWHLTLVFLGDMPSEDVPEVEAAVSRGVLDAGRAMRLRLCGGGTFGRGRSAAVWAGVDGDLEALRGLHAALRGRLAEAGFSSDERPLTPHLTVSRKSGPDLLAALPSYVGPVWSPTEIVLVRSSFPQRGGYETLRAWPLPES